MGWGTGCYDAQEASASTTDTYTRHCDAALNSGHVYRHSAWTGISAAD